MSSEDESNGIGYADERSVHAGHKPSLPQDQARAVEAKSLGEKLCEASGPFSQCWKALTDASRAEYEKVALAFVASLSHDETATAVITAQAEEIERLEGLCADHLRMTQRLSTRLAESEAREGAYKSALLWALGLGDDFPMPTTDKQGRFWWRTELAKRAGIDLNAEAAALTLKGGN